jgi:hypothetical protein
MVRVSKPMAARGIACEAIILAAIAVLVVAPKAAVAQQKQTCTQTIAICDALKPAGYDCKPAMAKCMRDGTYVKRDGSVLTGLIKK